MPAFDFKCSQCGAVEECFLGRFQSEVNCTHCGSVAEYLPSFYYSSPAQTFAPVVVHRSADGKYRLPGNADAPVPSGYERVELNTLSEIRNFERGMNNQELERSAKHQREKSEFLDAQLKYSRECVAHTVATQFSERGRKFYEKMREVSEAKQKEYRKVPDPNFHLEAFSFDSSNRVSHRDASNSWGQKNRK